MNARSQNILGVFLLLTSIAFFIMAYTIVRENNYKIHYILDIIDGFVSLMIFPMMYFFFKSLTNENFFNRKDYLWLLPSVIVGILSFVLYLMMGFENAISYIRSLFENCGLTSDFYSPLYKIHYFINYKLFNAIILVECIAVGIYSIISLISYHRRLSDFYSSLDDKSVNLGYSVLIWFMVSILFAFIFIFTGGTSFWVQHKLLASFYFIAWGVVYFGLFYQGSRITYTVQDLAKDLRYADMEAVRNNYIEPEVGVETDDTDIEVIKTVKYVKLLDLFNKCIDEDKVFLDSTLRIDKLARMMCTNRTYISSLIRLEYKCTFSDYINCKRVEYAQDIMRSNPDIKQIELSEKTGFLSVTSFSRTFKHVVGIPPKEWLTKNVK